MAVIGTGCSGTQVVPAIQPTVEHVDVYQRSPGWTFPRMDFAYKERTKRLFERLPLIQRLDRNAIFAFQTISGFPPFAAKSTVAFVTVPGAPTFFSGGVSLCGCGP